MRELISRQVGAMGLLRFGTHQIAQLLQHLREEVAILSFHVTLQIILSRAVEVTKRAECGISSHSGWFIN
jgi:hypothetical protein